MDGEVFEVETPVAILSELVKTLVADDQDEGDEIQEITLPNVKGHVLAKVVEFCRHHKDAPMADIQESLKSANLSECVDPWDAQFVNLDQKLLYKLILAADYMDIKSLLDLSIAKLVAMIKGKTPEEIRANFVITEEFTEEEQQRILEEH
eukprot:jgi/Phyca11/577586/estExt2_Genewise1.C_PHYCAscaffold_1510012